MELLVVVTIIVILLALLTPALDSAVYQAELAVCAARVRSLAQAPTMYASENKRSYPDRETYRGGKYKTNRPNRLWLANGTNPNWDQRRYIRPYLGSINKGFQCPFLPEMDLDLPDVETRSAGQTAWASYQFWWGWQYSVTDGGAGVEGVGSVGGTVRATGRGMFRLGDKFTYSPPPGDRYTPPGEHSFDIIANDFDLSTFPEDASPFGNASISSHPDKDDKMAVNIQEFEPTHLWSRWQASPYGRGLLDLNFGRTDNSVQRYSDVVCEIEPAGHVPDDRMVRVPEGNADEWIHWRNILPAAN